MAFALTGLVLGALAGFFVGRPWAGIVVAVAPLPWYLGAALGLWGDGFGEYWWYSIPIWIVPVCVGFVTGAIARNARVRAARRRSFGGGSEPPADQSSSRGAETDSMKF